MEGWGEYSSEEEHLASKCKVLGSIPGPANNISSPKHCSEGLRPQVVDFRSVSEMVASKAIVTLDLKIK